MEKELGDAIKMVLAIIGAIIGGIGFIWGAIWVIVKFTSSKDSDINKGYNRNLETKIDLNKEMQEKELANQKEDIKKAEGEISSLRDTVGLMANGITELSGNVKNLVKTIEDDKKATKEATKVIIERNTHLEAANKIAEGRLVIEEKKLEEKTGVFKEELKKVSETFTELVNDPQIKKELEKQGIEINKRIDEVVGDVKSIKKDFDDLASLTNGACKEREVVSIVEKALDNAKDKDI